MAYIRWKGDDTVRMTTVASRGPFMSAQRCSVSLSASLSSDRQTHYTYYCRSLYLTSNDGLLWPAGRISAVPVQCGVEIFSLVDDYLKTELKSRSLRADGALWHGRLSLVCLPAQIQNGSWTAATFTLTLDHYKCFESTQHGPWLVVPSWTCPLQYRRMSSLERVFPSGRMNP